MGLGGIETLSTVPLLGIWITIYKFEFLALTAKAGEAKERIIH